MFVSFFCIILYYHNRNLALKYLCTYNTQCLGFGTKGSLRNCLRTLVQTSPIVVMFRDSINLRGNMRNFLKSFIYLHTRFCKSIIKFSKKNRSFLVCPFRPSVAEIKNFTKKSCQIYLKGDKNIG